MTDRIISLPSVCECGAHVWVGERHKVTCFASYDAARLQAMIDPVSIADMPGRIELHSRPAMDYAKVVPSLKNRCPRTGCNLDMASYREGDFTVWICPTPGHYTCKERSV